MNEDIRKLEKVMMYSYFFFTGPIGIVFFMYIFLRGKSLTEALAGNKDILLVESFVTGFWIYSYMRIKIKGWDFWNKKQ